MSTTPLWTVRTLLAWSVPWLTQKGVENARLDSELLLANALNLRRIDLFLDPHRYLTAEELTSFKLLIKRRAAREPIAYILGVKEFWGLEFLTSREALIPRPETELLLETTLSYQPERQTPMRILELGAGSGAVLCSLLTEYPLAHGTGIDLSSQALKLAQKNAAKIGVAERIEWLESDLDTMMPPTDGFDVIIANPPYIATGELNGLQAEVRDWEPHMALDGGEDGLKILSRIPTLAKTRLVPGGLCVTEIGCDQAEAALELFLLAGFPEPELLYDYHRLPRAIQAINT
ncbi:MAG: peptide chain release factor N(5)-glutamine methyltransferase [Magnetococcus sp. YQC-5]